MDLKTTEKVDWEYSMRREMQLIVPGLYLGPFSAASKAKFQCLIDHGITHIVCVRHHMEARYIRPNFPEQIKYLVVEVADHPCENIMKHFEHVSAFMKEGLSNHGKILVHGNAGISRSATLVIAFIMKQYEVSFSEAYDCVRNQRFCIMPNTGFLQQLKEYEPIFRAQISFMNQGENDESSVFPVGALKRKAVEAELDSSTMDYHEKMT